MAVSVSELYEALVDAGAPKDQARRAAEAVISRHEAEHQLATKADLATLKADVAGVEAALRSEIAAVEARLRGEIQDLRAEMLAMKVEIIKWNVGTILAAVGLTIAIVRLLG